MAGERLQKVLAAAGISSRRKAEELITAGRVKVNGEVVTELGTRVDPTRDLVVVDGKPIARPERHRYVLLYKPPGCVTTLSDPQGRRTAVDYLSGVSERVFPVGRLDYDAEGAVLFTTDGDLANRLAHPRYGHQRVYLVKVKGDAPEEEGKLEAALLRMRSGLRLEDGPAKALAADVHEHADKNVWLRVVVGEGRYHLVKRLCEAVGLLVLRLFRPEFGGVSVQGLRPGRWRDLSADEVRSMKALVSGDARGREATGEVVARRPLPKPGRRHGHGAPLPGGGAAPRKSPESAEAPERAGAERAGARGRPERSSGGDGASPRGRPERSSESERSGARGRPERSPGADRSRPRGRAEHGAADRRERDVSPRGEARDARRRPGQRPDGGRAEGRSAGGRGGSGTHGGAARRPKTPRDRPRR